MFLPQSTSGSCCNISDPSSWSWSFDEALAEAAASFGFTDDYTIGLTTFPGSFPEVADSTENAAAGPRSN